MRALVHWLLVSLNAACLLISFVLFALIIWHGVKVQIGNVIEFELYGARRLFK